MRLDTGEGARLSVLVAHGGGFTSKGGGFTSKQGFRFNVKHRFSE